MSKGRKYVIHMLKERTADSAQSMFGQKEVFFDTLNEVQEVMKNIVEQDSGHSIEALNEEISGLSDKYQKVDDVLRDVIKVTEFDVD